MSDKIEIRLRECLFGQSRQKTEFVGRTDKHIIINNTFCRGLETAPTKK
nr:MAG TPA_asm: hypothetical protein [Caudoviricetes sp.]